jgi:uncharacterized protein (TIGR02284 family)
MKTETINALRSLITINSDRQKDYEEAAKDTPEEDLKSLFDYFSKQSKAFSDELKPFIHKAALKELSNSPLKTIKYSAIPVSDRKAILSSIEFREEAAKRTYDEIMEHTEYLSGEIYNVLSSQRTELHKSHNAVRALYFNF